MSNTERQIRELSDQGFSYAEIAEMLQADAASIEAVLSSQGGESAKAKGFDCKAWSETQVRDAMMTMRDLMLNSDSDMVRLRAAQLIAEEGLGRADKAVQLGKNPVQVNIIGIMNDHFAKAQVAVQKALKMPTDGIIDAEVV